MIATMVVPGSIAAAHLDLLLRVQIGTASLPTEQELSKLVADAGLVLARSRRPVPTEPFVVMRASAPGST